MSSNRPRLVDINGLVEYLGVTSATSAAASPRAASRTSSGARSCTSTSTRSTPGSTSTATRSAKARERRPTPADRRRGDASTIQDEELGPLRSRAESSLGLPLALGLLLLADALEGAAGLLRLDEATGLGVPLTPETGHRVLRLTAAPDRSDPASASGSVLGHVRLLFQKCTPALVRPRGRR